MSTAYRPCPYYRSRRRRRCWLCLVGHRPSWLGTASRAPVRVAPSLFAAGHALVQVDPALFEVESALFEELSRLSHLAGNLFRRDPRLCDDARACVHATSARDHVPRSVFWARPNLVAVSSTLDRVAPRLFDVTFGVVIVPSPMFHGRSSLIFAPSALIHVRSAPIAERPRVSSIARHAYSVRSSVIRRRSRLLRLARDPYRARRAAISDESPENQVNSASRYVPSSLFRDASAALSVVAALI